MDDDDGMMLNFFVPEPTANIPSVEKRSGDARKGKQANAKSKNTRQQKAQPQVDENGFTEEDKYYYSQYADFGKPNILNKLPNNTTPTQSQPAIAHNSNSVSAPKTHKKTNEMDDFQQELEEYDQKYSHPGKTGEKQPRLPKQARSKWKMFVRDMEILDQEKSKEFAEKSTERDVKKGSVFSDDVVVADLNLNEKFKKNMQENMNITKLTKIQSASLQPLMDGKDLLMESETGSGKTLAYLIPVIEQLAVEPRVKREEGTLALILAPTRELCIQVQEVFIKAAKHAHWLVPGVVMGGEKKKSEKARFRKGIHVLIATPGRLLDHLQHTSSFKLDNLRYLILDEADRLLDLGFERDVSQIISILQERLPKKPQGVLVSATLRKGIQRLASMSLRDPVQVGFSSHESNKQEEEKSEGAKQTTKESQNKKFEDADSEPEEDEDSKKTTANENKDRGVVDMSDDESPNNQRNSSTNEDEEYFAVPTGLTQHYVVVPCKLRLVTLFSFIKWKTTNLALNDDSSAKTKMIVFFSCCDSVEYHYSLFSRTIKILRGDIQDSKFKLDVPVFKLHGSMGQKERTKIYFDFSKAESGVLLCTDVAARGLDLPHVNWIVQYDTPGDPKDYLHRVGRTARLNSSGESLLFLMPHEVPYIHMLESFNHIKIRVSSAEIILQSLIKPLNIKNKNVADAAATLQYSIEQLIHNDSSLYELGCAGFRAHIKSYSTHSKSSRHIFHVKSLHLGHVCKTFGLTDTPSTLMKKDYTSVTRTKKGEDYGRKNKDKEDDKEKSKAKKDNKPSHNERLKRLGQIDSTQQQNVNLNDNANENSTSTSITYKEHIENAPAKKVPKNGDNGKPTKEQLARTYFNKGYPEDLYSHLINQAVAAAAAKTAQSTDESTTYTREEVLEELGMIERRQKKRQKIAANKGPKVGEFDADVDYLKEEKGGGNRTTVNNKGGRFNKRPRGPASGANQSALKRRKIY